MDAATAVAVECLDLVDAGGRPLVVDEESGALAQALTARGARPAVWLRRAAGSAQAKPWPDAGGCTSAFVRMAKSKEALQFALHAAAALLPAGAPIVVLGSNAEGVRSAARHLDDVADAVETFATKRHSRVIGGRRRETIASLKGQLADWRQVGSIFIAGTPRPWISFPGCFAKGGLDAGTALLLAHLPAFAPGAQVLDFAAGTGVIAAAIAARNPSARLDLVEIDSLALVAAGENVPGARLLAGSGLGAVQGQRYDAIVANPPFHAGLVEDHAVLQGLIADAPAHLKPGARLVIVVQARIPADAMLVSVFGAVERIAETGQFRVLGARKR